MQQPDKTTTLQYGGQHLNVKIYSNVDKTTDFIYYTFDFGITKIIISKFDGDHWRIANSVVEDEMAGLLANLLGKEK